MSRVCVASVAVLLLHCCALVCCLVCWDLTPPAGLAYMLSTRQACPMSVGSARGCLVSLHSTHLLNAPSTAFCQEGGCGHLLMPLASQPQWMLGPAAVGASLLKLKAYLRLCFVEMLLTPLVSDPCMHVVGHSRPMPAVANCVASLHAALALAAFATATYLAGRPVGRATQHGVCSQGMLCWLDAWAPAAL